MLKVLLHELSQALHFPTQSTGRATVVCVIVCVDMLVAIAVVIRVVFLRVVLWSTVESEALVVVLLGEPWH